MGNKNVEVVMVPFPEQSHLNQLLQLSHVISSHNIKVHYVASDLHISQVRSRAAADPSPNLHFHGLPTPDFPSPPPNDTRFPTHLIPCFEASSAELRQPTKSLLSSLSKQASKLVIIHDPMMSFVVQDSAELTNAEPYVYYCISAISHFVMIRDILGLRLREDVPSPGAAAELPELRRFVQKQFEALGRSKKAGILYNTCRVLDGEFLNLIGEKERESDEEIGIWALGPLETVTRFGDEKRLIRTKGVACLEWLDEQEPGSVLYVSFGTTTFMENDQIEELAIGLEKSSTKFVWVLRDADRANVFDESGGARRHKLPLGFEERMERTGMGIVVREWAPQLEILGHSSTGGFMSHCGWNSVLESLSLGVPLVAWPMHSDQPTNAFLVTEILKAGLALRELPKRDDDLVSSSAIGEAVKRLMGSDQLGGEIRKRARELGRELRKCTEEGGVSRLELESFLAHVTRA